MAPLLGIGLITGLALLLGSSTARLGRTPARRLPRRPEPQIEEETIAELIASDPIEALRRYGTPQDAARLAERGVNLAALGYKP